MATISGVLKPRRPPKVNETLSMRIAAVENTAATAKIGKEMRTLYNDLMAEIEKHKTLCMEAERMNLALLGKTTGAASSAVINTRKVVPYYIDKTRFTAEDKEALLQLHAQQIEIDRAQIEIMKKSVQQKIDKDEKKPKPKKVKAADTLGFDAMLYPPGMRNGCTQTSRGRERGKELVQ